MNARGNLDEVRQSLQQLQRAANPSLFHEIWHSYVGNAVWEFFGIKRDPNTRPTVVGRVVSLLGLIIVGLKLRYWLRKNSGARNGSGERVVNGLWILYGMVLAIAFASLSWAGAVTQLNPEAMAFHESVNQLSNELEAVQALPSTLKSIDTRLSGLESRATDPSLFRQVLSLVLWSGAMFVSVVGGIHFYKKVLD